VTRLDRLVNRVPAPLRAPVGSLLVTARRREWCVARPTGDGWTHRYRAGVTVQPRLGGASARLQDQQTRDAFLYDYEPVTGDVVFDIGAGVGGEVRLLSRLVGPSGRVVSVEAHPRTYRLLTTTVRLNGLTNVTPIHAALTGETGPVHLTDDEHHLGNRLAAGADGHLQVPGHTLPDLMAATGAHRIDLLKLNIEGAELESLQAAEACLAGVRNVVISCHDFKADAAGGDWQRTYRPVQELLLDNGFTLRLRPDDPRCWIRYYVYGTRLPAAED
jgi:FkbM family methyltransferase